MNSELTFIRNGNVPSSNTFNLKLNKKEIIKNLILETQNSKFPNFLNITTKDFLNNTITIKANVIRTLGNIQEWELEAILTDELKVTIEGEEASIINVTPILTEGTSYYLQEDIDARVSREDIDLLNSNIETELILKLENSKIINRINFNREFENLEILYSPGEGQDWISLNYIDIHGIKKFHPVLVKGLCFRSSQAINLKKEDIEIYIFNYLEHEINSLFEDTTLTEVKSGVTIQDIITLEMKTNKTEEYLNKLAIARNLLVVNMDTKRISINNEKHQILNRFSYETSGVGIYRATVNYEDRYGNKKSKTSNNILNNIITFENFYGKDLELTLYGPNNETEIVITTILESQDSYYLTTDLERSIDRTNLVAESGCGVYSGNLGPDKAIDNYENTNFHSTRYSEYGDFYITNPEPQVVDELHLLTRNTSLGRVENYTVLYKESSNEEWLVVGESINEGLAGNWRNIKFNPIFASNICIRVNKSNENHVLIYDLQFLKYNTLEDDLKSLFEDEDQTILKESVTLDILESLEARISTTKAYILMFNKALELFINSLNPLNLTIDILNESVMNQIKLLSNKKILKAIVKTSDAYNNEIVFDAINIDGQESQYILDFNYFYGKTLILSLYGVSLEESDISNLEITALEQDQFIATEDVDTRLNKSIMEAKSGCGHYASDVPSKAIDGNMDTSFHSSTYSSEVGYGDFYLNFGGVFLIDRVMFYTRVSHNGRIKTYKILYKTSSVDEWKEIYEEPAEKSGVLREALFKTILATEICVRVTNGHNNFIVINEIDIFKHNQLEDEINSLFIDNDYKILADGVTLEQIDSLDERITTESYQEKIEIARSLYIDGLTPKIFELPLGGYKIFNRINFVTDERILRIALKYQDSLLNTHIKVCNYTKNDESISIEIGKIFTKKAELLISGVERIYKVSTNNLNIDDYSSKVDEDTTIDLSLGELSASHNHSSLERARDKDLNLSFHSGIYSDKGYTDLILKFTDEYLIDRGQLLSYRSNSSGLVNSYKLMVKDLLTEEYVVLGESSYSEIYINEWKTIKSNSPFLTNEIVFRVTDSVNKWAIINEVELYRYNQLKDEINNLFVDSECSILKDEISYEQILEVEKKITVTTEYVSKIQRAKELFLEKLTPATFTIDYNHNIVLNSLEILFKEKPEYIYTYKLEYVNSLNENKYVENLNISEDSSTKAIATFNEIFTNKIIVKVYMKSFELWKFSCAHTIDLDQSKYYNIEDKNNAISNLDITATSHCGVAGGNNESLMLDNNNETYFHSSKLGSVLFVLNERKVIDEFWVNIQHSNGNNGKISSAKIFYRDSENSEWNLLLDYKNSSPRSGLNSFVFPPVLLKEICIKVDEAYAGILVFNEVGLNIYNSIEKKIDDLFVDPILLSKLNPEVTFKSIENLKNKVIDNKVFLAKLYIAESILKNNKKLPFKINGFKSIAETSSSYFSKLGTNNTGDLCLTPYYIFSNTDHVIVCSRDITGVLLLGVNKPNIYHTINLKRGLNIVNTGDQTGQLGFKGGRSEEIKYYSLNKENALIYRYGYTTEDELFSKPNNEAFIQDHHSSNLAYIEGRNFIGAVQYSWIKNEIIEGDLTRRVELTDEYLDFLYYLDNVHSYFKNSIPYKRLMWSGIGTDNPHAGGSAFGGYTAYNGSSSDVLKPSLSNFASSWVVGHEVGHEMDVNRYHMGLFGEVSNNWYAEECRLEFTKSIRTQGNLSGIISENPQSIFEMGYFDRLAFFIKLRLFYNDNSFFQKMNNYMQNINTVSPEDISGKLACFSTRIVRRDVSDYFIKYGFTLTEESIAYCNQFPKPALDMMDITWENQDEFRREEIRLFNLKYKG